MTGHTGPDDLMEPEGVICGYPVGDCALRGLWPPSDPTPPARDGGEILARVVWQAWRDGMLGQGRDVAPARLQWETLSDQDKALDAFIAAQVLDAAARAAASKVPHE